MKANHGLAWRIATAVTAFTVACSVKGGDSGGCWLGPCQPSYSLPEFAYRVVGRPDILGSDASRPSPLRVGDTLIMYFVRRRYLAPCNAPADTLLGGAWAITGPWGQFGDFSQIASVTPSDSGRAVVRALAP